MLRVAIPILLLSFSVIFVSQLGVSEAQAIPQLLYVNLSLAKIAQVSFSNGSSWFQANIAAEITYTGDDPPKWIVFTESSVPAGASTDFGETVVAAFGNNTWTQIGTHTWKPALMVSGPYQLPGRYDAYVTNDVNSWPNENISFIFAFAISNVTMSGHKFTGPVTMNIDTSNAASVHYYTPRPTPGVSFTTTIFGTPVEGHKVRWDLSHDNTVVQGLVHVTILREFYVPLIVVLSVLVALKIAALGVDGLSRRWRRITVRRGISWLYALSSHYKATTMAGLIATIVVFVPLYDLAVATYVPSWVSFFNEMMGTVFLCSLALLVVSLVLIPFDNSNEKPDVDE